MSTPDGQRRRSVDEHACIWSEKGRMKRAVKQRNMPRCAAKNHASTGSDNSQEKLAWTPCLNDFEFIVRALLLLKVRYRRQVRSPIRSLGQVFVGKR
jgi:hypothetical protein